MERTFYVTGKEPAFGAQVNDLVRAFDLGVEGAYVSFAQKLTATMADDISDDKLEQQAAGIKTAYEQAGCVSVQVTEIGMEGNE